MDSSKCTKMDKSALAKFFIFLLCFGGLIWQLHYVSREYFSYKFVTQVTIEDPEQLEPPKIIFCFLVGKIKHTIRKRFDESPKIEQILITFKNYISNSSLISYRYINTALTCYVIGSDYSKPDKGSEIGFQGIINTLILNQTFFELNKDSSLQMAFIDVMANETRIQSFDIRKMGMYNLSKIRARFFFSYTQYYSKLLPHPYSTDCADYQSLVNVQSRFECRNQCIIKNFLGQFKKFPVEVSTEIPYNISMALTKVLRKQDKNLYDKLIEHCQNICRRKDCISNRFNLVLIKRIVSGERFHLILMAPSVPKFFTLYTPMMLLIDFVTYVLSCISFWLAFSPLTSLILSVKYLNFKSTKRNEKFKSVTRFNLKRLI